MSDNSKTYIGMLADILDRKQKVLENILSVTVKQMNIISAGESAEAFDDTLTEKDSLIEELNRLDNGFSDAYAKVSAELSVNKNNYKNEILGLQKKITSITDIGVKIQALEEQNRIAFEQYLSGQRRKIKDFKLSSKTVSNYYKNMTGKPQGESYFMDKKK